MSTTVMNRFGAAEVVLDAYPSDGVECIAVATRSARGTPEWYSNFDRADFLAAVEAECGVRIVPADSIVIEPSEPLAQWEAELLLAGERNLTADRARSIGTDYFHMAQHLDAHPHEPPVDEAQVAALSVALIANEEHDFQTDDAYARRLYLAGVRIEPTEATS
ncbi:MAG: hypothetical protein JJE50_01520 [Actinomycetales bacterium]|nr:hypothetical protein [Actinomycetales bacterium]